MVEGLDHVQLAMPPGGEERARAYFAGLLGLDELEKPAVLAGRGGVWFGLPDGRQIHLGVEEPFRPGEKAHPAFGCAALDDLAWRLEESGYAVGRGAGAAAEVLCRGPFREQDRIHRAVVCRGGYNASGI
jgi:hypothetical protein